MSQFVETEKTVVDVQKEHARFIKPLGDWRRSHSCNDLTIVYKKVCTNCDYCSANNKKQDALPHWLFIFFALFFLYRQIDGLLELQCRQVHHFLPAPEAYCWWNQ